MGGFFGLETKPNKAKERMYCIHLNEMHYRFPRLSSNNFAKTNVAFAAKGELV